MLNKSLTLAVLLAASTSASAAPIIQMGLDVTFSYDDATLFGTGTVLGNSIFFSPDSFIATSTNGAGEVITSQSLNILVDVKKTSNYLIGGFQIAEEGDYLLDGVNSTVSAQGRLGVVSQTTLCGILPCRDSDIFSAGTLTTTGALTEWTAGTTIDLGDTLGWGSDTSVEAQILNILTASTLVNGEGAIIQKTFEGVGLVVVPEVPVPAAAWLFGSALLGLGALKRKKA